MALTKVRLPVADIESISNGTSNINIATEDGNAVVTVGGTTIGTFSSTGLNLGGLTLIVDTLQGEIVSLSQGAVASKIEAAVSQGVAGTTSAHPFSLIANAIEGLSIGTDGRVSLGVQGNANGHLVTKQYVDNAAGATSTTATMASEGHVSIPTTSGNLIINWGTVNGNNNNLIPVTFNQTFPTAAFVAMAVRVSTSTSLDRTVNVANLSTTGMNIRNNTNTSTPVYWMAIGY
jgi:hypothetical protein